MPDCQKCTCSTPSPPDDDGDALFRHTFLWRLTNPDDREALLRLAEGWNSAMYEAGCWGEGDPPMLASMAAALADDVESLGAYALIIARVGGESRLPPGEMGICCAAPRWAERLAHLAVEIREVCGCA